MQMFCVYVHKCIPHTCADVVLVYVSFVSIRKHLSISMCICTCIGMCMCKCVCMCICTYIYTYVCMFVQRRACIYMCLHVHVRMYMPMYKQVVLKNNGQLWEVHPAPLFNRSAGISHCASEMNRSPCRSGSQVLRTG